MKKIIAFFMTIILALNIILSNVLTALATEETYPDLGITAKSAILMEAKSGKVIYEKNADEKLRPASVTKIMTLLIIFEEIETGNLSLDDVVTVTEHAASMGGSQCFFEAGEQQTVKDMIKCIEIASGNDAAVAMAEHISGSEALFVERMNERAKELGMNNTSFKNACGLEAEEHYTCARDIGIMSRELIVNHPEIKEYATTWMDYIIHKTSRGESRFDLANTNKFLRQYNGATGLKTGYTSQAKYCMSATAEREGVELIAVIMGAETKEIRNSEAAMLLDYGFSVCETFTDNNVLESKIDIPVKLGVKKSIDYKCDSTKNIYIINGNIENIEKNVVVYSDLEAPIYEGDIVGVVEYSYEGNIIDEVFIYAAENIERMSYGYSLNSVIRQLFMVK